MNALVSVASASAASTAVAAPSLAPTHTSTDDRDAELIALGAELGRRIEHADKLWKKAHRLRGPVDLMVEKALKGVSDDDYDYKSAFDIAVATPVGKRWRVAADAADGPCEDAHELAEKIMVMPVHTAGGLGVMAMAAAYISGNAQSFGCVPDLARLVKACAAVAGIQLPKGISKAMDDAIDADGVYDEAEAA